MINNVNYNITDICNLKCKHCNQFCPLVPEDTKHKSIQQITSDLVLLSKFKSNINTISITGGEPTLHPQLSDILSIARKYFPDNKINLLTNGTNYNKFMIWKKSIVDNNIMVVVTIYPYVNDTWDRYFSIENIIPDNISYNSKPYDFGMNYISFHRYCACASDEQIYNCSRRFNECQVNNGKLYICPFASQIHYLIDKFKDNVNIKVNTSEYIDLTDDNLTGDDIENFLLSTIPSICYHCLDVTNGGAAGPKEKWSDSNNELSEWFIE